MEYLELGPIHAPPILFLHGFMGGKEDFLETAAILGDRHRCIFLDLPGHGGSSFNTKIITKNPFEDLGNHLIKFLRERSLSRISLVGYSMGGRLALYFATHFPQWVDKILVESADPGIDDQELRKKRLEEDRKLFQGVKVENFPDFLGRWYGQKIFGSLKEDARFPQLLSARISGHTQSGSDLDWVGVGVGVSVKGLQAALNLMSVGNQPSLWSKLRELTGPMAYVHGEQDEKYQLIGDRLESTIPGINRVKVLNCGHNTHFQKPGVFKEILEAFFITEK